MCSNEYDSTVSSIELQNLSSDLRTARFQALRQLSNNILADTWYEDDLDVIRYWPGGKKSFDKYFYDLCQREQEALSTFTDKYDWKLLGIGSGRVVISPPEPSDIAFKIARYGISARFGDGRQANRIETDRWESISTYPLLPIYDWEDDFSWVSCPIAEPLDSFDNNKLDIPRICEQVQSSLEKYSEKVSTRDIGADNIGRVDGRWYWIDYGQPEIDNAHLYGVFPSVF